MTFTEKFDSVPAGIISGLLLPAIVGFTIFLFTSGNLSLQSYLDRISDSDIITHAISICVFPNVIIFLLFNRLDMLRGAKGVLAITIIWAIIVFAIKLF